MSPADDRELEDLLERLRTRFHGKYRGTVSAVQPSTMRIKARVPSVLGDIETGWCMPCVPYAGPKVGFAFLPEIGSGVWIEFEGGDLSYPIWVGGYWRQNEFPAGPAEDVKLIITKEASQPGQQAEGREYGLRLNDTQGSITISDLNGNTVTLDSSGIKLANGQSSVTLDSSGVKLANGKSSVVISSTSVSVNNGALEVKG